MAVLVAAAVLADGGVVVWVGVAVTLASSCACSKRCARKSERNKVIERERERERERETSECALSQARSTLLALPLSVAVDQEARLQLRQPPASPKAE